MPTLDSRIDSRYQVDAFADQKHRHVSLTHCSSKGVSRRESWIALWIVACLFLLSISAAAQSKGDEPTIEELRRLIEKQQQVCEAQQKRLEALEKRIEERQPVPASYSKTGAAPSDRPEAASAPQSSLTLSTQITKEITREGFGIKLYGFLRGDMAGDTDRMSFDTQLPFFVLSPADASQSMRRTGDVTFHPPTYALRSRHHSTQAGIGVGSPGKTRDRFLQHSHRSSCRRRAASQRPDQ
jgi:uncharacterized coiled-coil protein SlyX